MIGSSYLYFQIDYFLRKLQEYFTGVSSKNKGKTVDMLIWCGIKNFYK
jgi:hypothetical protein